MEEDFLNEIQPEETEKVEQAEVEEKQKSRRFSLTFKVILFVTALVTVFVLIFLIYFFNLVYGNQLSSLKKDKILYIPSGSTIGNIADVIQKEGLVPDKSNFLFVASLMKYKGKSGRYIIPKSTKSYHGLISILRKNQIPLKLTFNNIRTKEQFAAHLDKLIEADSLSIIRSIINPVKLTKFGFNEQNVLAMYIPNTYEFYWNSNSEQFVDRMYQEYQKFWTKERLAKAEKQKLSPAEVYILASIVDAETTYNPEKKRVAGVYLNRLRTKGWRLEADPTVVFAMGDFSIRRVTRDMLNVDSPYNSYRNDGLPPGPIRMASVAAIDAVLDAEEHQFMFFCAKPQLDGEPAQHVFAENMNQHANNARIYRQWLNSRNIYR
jgi:UPF0755 protein